MWTGDKVIPEIITKDSIQELGEVLQRKPVIWDNIHANDYDQRRVYLGAYCGRPIELYPYLNGILTNPNCEFEANFVAIHTLGTWYRIASSTYNQDESFDVQMEDLSDDENQPVSSDDCDMSDESLPPLTAADVTSVVSEYSPKEALKLAISDWLNEFSTDKRAPLKIYSKRNLKTMVVNGQTVLSAAPYDLDNITATEDTINTMMEDKIKQMFLTDDHIMLLTDLFCLPYEHGSQGNRILYEFGWLIENVTDIYEQPPSKEKVSRWFDKLLKCDEHCQDVYKLFENFCMIPNEAILYDLYPYLWDLKEVVLALETFVHWLSDTMTTTLSVDILNVIRPVLNPSFQNIPLMNDFTEPWHIKYLGGLTVALHKLLPFRGGYMFLDNAPDTPSNNMVKTRTYSHTDKDALYKFCVNDNNDDNVDTKTFKHGEVEVGSYVSVCPETLLLVEDVTGICGYIAAIPDNQRYIEEARSTWLPAMKEKHADFDADVLALTNVEGWNQPTSSHLVVKLNKPVYEQCFRRILSSALSVLKASGALTVFHEIQDCNDLDMYRKLGFFPVNEDPHQKVFWRNL